MNDEELRLLRQKNLGLYSIRELCTMFDCSRASIDFALNTGLLGFVSPNNRDRYIYLNDYLEYLNNKKDTGVHSKTFPVS